MLVLFDQSAPAPLRDYLKGHVVTEARERGWDRLANGELLDAAEAAGFVLRRYAARVALAVDAAVAGSYVEVGVPFE